MLEAAEGFALLGQSFFLERRFSEAALRYGDAAWYAKEAGDDGAEQAYTEKAVEARRAIKAQLIGNGGYD